MTFETAILNVRQMAEADRLAVSAGTPAVVLMENAGQAVAREIERRWTPRPVTVLCGPGNNGGDGFVIARRLMEAGWPVRLALPCPPDRLTGEAKHHAGLWQGKVELLTPAMVDGAELVVDAIFGAGLSRALGGPPAETLMEAARRRLPIVAVDVPSGLMGDTGENLGAVAAVLTVTFFRKKPGHLLLPGRKLCGEVVVADIGIPATVLEKIQPATLENDPRLWVGQKPMLQAGRLDLEILNQDDYHRHFGLNGDILGSLRSAALCNGGIMLLAGDNIVVVAPDGRAIIHPGSLPMSKASIELLNKTAQQHLAEGKEPFLAVAAAVWLNNETHHKPNA